jgi:hypothetical protein
MDQSELLPGVLSMLHYLKEKNQPMLWDQPAKCKTYSEKTESDIILMLL